MVGRSFHSWGSHHPFWALLRTLKFFFQTVTKKQTQRKGHKNPTESSQSRHTHVTTSQTQKGNISSGPGVQDSPPGATLPVPVNNTVLTARAAFQGLPLLTESAPCHPAALNPSYQGKSEEAEANASQPARGTHTP